MRNFKSSKPSAGAKQKSFEPMADRKEDKGTMKSLAKKKHARGIID
jgi:hypothetical protein